MSQAVGLRLPLSKSLNFAEGRQTKKAGAVTRIGAVYPEVLYV